MRVLTVVGHFVVGDFLLLQEVLRHDLVDLVDGFGGELVGTHVDRRDVLVAFQGVFQGGGVGLLDHVARHVHRLNGRVHLQELGQRLAEHVAELVGTQTEELQTRVVVQQVDAKLGASLVIKSIQAKVQRDE